ncbi:MAG: hypothetical protein Q9166_005782 [cf. Caloplaca sp. 2 TL-2023]
MLPPVRSRTSGFKNVVTKSFHQSFHKTFLISTATARPTYRRNPSCTLPGLSLAIKHHRTIFIQTENTPNADVSDCPIYRALADSPEALKFLPNLQILPQGLSSPFIEYLNPRSTLSPPFPSPLAARLLSIDGITAVFYGPDFITITKAADANWAHVKPEVFSLITEAVNSGERIVNTSEKDTSAAAQNGGVPDSLAYDEKDSEVVGMIKELLETRIRPAIQDDGGDVDFCGFENGKVLLKLRGACRTCDSSTVTLKNGIESMLMHYIEEVQGVTQVVDEAELISNEEFARFEEKLRERKGVKTATA